MSFKTITTAAVLVSAALWTATASAQQTTVTTTTTAEQPVQETARPNRKMLTTGGAIIAASYIPAVVVAATSDHAGDKNLYIPVAGPWMDLAQRGGCGPNPCGDEAIYKSLLVTAGVAHLVGVGLVVGSLFSTEERTVMVGDTKPRLVPAQFGKSGAGFALVGSF
jgi:hypothetical protein